MHVLLVCFYNVFLMGMQVISQAEALGHWVVTFVPYFNAENLAALGTTDGIIAHDAI
jgi:hypothetical protein